MSTRWWTRRGRSLLCLSLAVGGLVGSACACSNSSSAEYIPPASASAAVASAAAAQDGQWLSGASSVYAASGKFGQWRHAPVQVGGTWENGNDAQVKLASICPGGDWAKWDKPLDIAVGAIEKPQGESWAEAAKGTYDARWTRSFTRMKACWGNRNPANLYLRFAHEMNLSVMAWSVKNNEIPDFIKAITRYSAIRYKILPQANIVLCPSDNSDDQLRLDARKLWPGRDSSGRPIVNVYAIDTYNGYSVVKTAQQFVDKLTADVNGIPFGMELHRQFAEKVGVPFAISEWSNNGDPKDAGKGGEAPEYVRQMNLWFRSHGGDPKNPRPGQLLYEIQFNLQTQFAFLPTKLQPKTAAMYRSLTWGK